MPIVPAIRSLSARAMYEVVRPLVQRLSPGAYDRVARVLAVPAGLFAVATSPRELSAFLRLVGQPGGVAARLRFGYRRALAQLRGAAVYLLGETPVRLGPRLQRVCDRGEPAMFVTWSTFSTVYAVSAIAGRGKVIRLPYGGEGGPGPDEVAPGARWAAHKAAVRQRLIGPHQILPTQTPLRYLRAVREGHSLLLLQDVLDPTGRAPTRRLFGRPFSLPVGSVRLAAAAELPLYVVELTIRDGVPCLETDGPCAQDEQGLLDRLEADIRRRPWEWELWRDFVEPAPAVAGAPASVQPAVA